MFEDFDEFDDYSYEAESCMDYCYGEVEDCMDFGMSEAEDCRDYAEDLSFAVIDFDW